MKIRDDQKPIRKDGFIADSMDGEMILHHPGSDRFLYLNQTAAIVWEQCGGSHTVGEIIVGLEEAFPASASQIRGDVELTLSTFYQNGCISLK